MVVPHIEGAFGRSVTHSFAVRAHTRHDDCSTVGAREAAMTAHDLEAGGQAFDVPFPRTRERFVKVVDVEEHSPFGGAEHAEVREVGIATELDPDARTGSVGQVIGHDDRPAPIEREGRHEHSAVARRDQLGYSARALLFQEGDGIRAIRRQLEVPVARSWRVTACCQAASHAFLHAEPLAAPRRRKRRTGPRIRRSTAPRHGSFSLSLIPTTSDARTGVVAPYSRATARRHATSIRTRRPLLGWCYVGEPPDDRAV